MSSTITTYEAVFPIQESYPHLLCCPNIESRGHGWYSQDSINWLFIKFFLLLKSCICSGLRYSVLNTLAGHNQKFHVHAAWWKSLYVTTAFLGCIGGAAGTGSAVVLTAGIVARSPWFHLPFLGLNIFGTRPHIQYGNTLCHKEGIEIYWEEEKFIADTSHTAQTAQPM